MKNGWGRNPVLTGRAGKLGSPLTSGKENFANAVAPDLPAISPEINKLVPGVYGNALQFTGDDKMEVFDVGHFSREHPFPASVWVRPNQHAPRGIFSRGGGADDAASMGYEFMLMDGETDGIVDPLLAG